MYVNELKLLITLIIKRTIVQTVFFGCFYFGNFFYNFLVISGYFLVGSNRSNANITYIGRMYWLQKKHKKIHVGITAKSAYISQWCRLLSGKRADITDAFPVLEMMRRRVCHDQSLLLFNFDRQISY